WTSRSIRHANVTPACSYAAVQIAYGSVQRLERSSSGERCECTGSAQHEGHVLHIHAVATEEAIRDREERPLARIPRRDTLPPRVTGSAGHHWSVSSLCPGLWEATRHELRAPSHRHKEGARDNHGWQDPCASRLLRHAPSRHADDIGVVG